MPSLVKLSLDIQPERRPWTERALLQAPAEENRPGTDPCRSSAEEGSVLELQPVQRHIPLGSSVIKSLWPTGTATKSWEGQGQVGAAQPCREPYQEHTTRQEKFPSPGSIHLGNPQTCCAYHHNSRNDEDPELR